MRRKIDCVMHKCNQHIEKNRYPQKKINWPVYTKYKNSQSLSVLLEVRTEVSLVEIVTGREQIVFCFLVGVQKDGASSTLHMHF